MRGGFKKLLPRNYGHEAFYIKVKRNTKFRVYKIEHVFSTVGEAGLIDFFVSYRDLRRFRAFFGFGTDRSIGIDCSADNYIKILEQLKSCGNCDISSWW